MAIEGKLVRLREQHPDDTQFLVDLRNTQDTQGFNKTLPTDYSLGMYEKLYDERTFSFDRRDARYIVEKKETGERVGMIGYSNYRPRFCAVIGIAFAKEFWSKELAYDAQETLLKFLYEELGVQVVRLWTNSGNPKAIKLAERSGFKQSGRTRESVFRRGKLYDNVVMDMLREEYYALHPELEDGFPGL